MLSESTQHSLRRLRTSCEGHWSQPCPTTPSVAAGRKWHRVRAKCSNDPDLRMCSMQHASASHQSLQSLSSHAVPSRSYLPLRVPDAQRMQRTQGTASCLPKLCTNMRRLAPEAAAFLRALSDQGFCGLGEAAKLAHAGTLCTFISFSSLESCHCSFAIPATQLETRKL